MESEDHRIVIQMDMVTASAEEILPDQNRSKNWPLFVLAQEIIFFSFYGYKLGGKKKKKEQISRNEVFLLQQRKRITFDSAVVE